MIQPIITHKTQRRWGGQKEYNRAFNIMVAAAEQSKNFSFPTLQEPVTLQEYCALTQQEKTDKIFFEQFFALRKPLLYQLTYSGHF